MATLYISEFKEPYSAAGSAIGTLMPQPAVVDQTVAVGATSAQSTAFSSQTRAIAISADTVCSVAFGSNPIATATNFRIAAGVVLYFSVNPGDKVAVIINT